MRIKKFKAKNFSEALSLVKKELGEDAIILSSEGRKGMRSSVEVTAAIDYENTEGKALNLPDLSGGHEPGEIADLKNEIKSLRLGIERMRDGGVNLNLPRDRRQMYEFLKEQSINDDFAFSLSEKASMIEDLEMVMSAEINTSNDLANYFASDNKGMFRKRKRIVMVVGPTGAGKTTSVAKLACKGIKEGKKVGIVSLDTFKIGASEQIRIYAKLMGIPLEIAADAKDIKKSIKKLSNRDIVLIDTTGQNPKESDYIRKLQSIYRTGYPIETQLLLSASNDRDFLMESHKHYSSLPVDYIAFTKTDEARKLGSIYNMCRLYQKPVAYITTGQRVPGNLEFVNSKELTNIILTSGSA
jgi:flagellar biosynthesis protein FlhF